MSLLDFWVSSSGEKCTHDKGARNCCFIVRATTLSAILVNFPWIVNDHCFPVSCAIRSVGVERNQSRLRPIRICSINIWCTLSVDLKREPVCRFTVYDGNWSRLANQTMRTPVNEPPAMKTLDVRWLAEKIAHKLDYIYKLDLYHLAAAFCPFSLDTFGWKPSVS